VAYRLLGRLDEVDDAVQESWLRLSGSDTSRIANLGAWLMTVVARVCLDMLRARHARREEPLEASVPQAATGGEREIDPEQEMELADSVGLALLVVLDTLAPAERLAFVLHDIFAVPFDEIAPLVERSEAAARQLASRARRRVRARAPMQDADLAASREVVEAFLTAAREGNFDALLAVLDPDVVLRRDQMSMPAGVPGELHGMEQSGLEEGPPLWPSQEQGIAQAMWVIEHVGSVLIADATGSGKTQMGAHLIKAVMNRTWSRGLNRRHDPPVLIAPGGVIEEWNRVSDDAGLALKIYADALVSRKQAEGYEVMERVIRRAQVLAVDEAHRYHNRKSTRTQQLYHNLADYVVLFTATPVNRGPSDLLRLIDLLGADNFDEEVLAIFDRLPRMQGKPEERRNKRKVVQTPGVVIPAVVGYVDHQRGQHVKRNATKQIGINCLPGSAGAQPQNSQAHYRHHILNVRQNIVSVVVLA